MYIVSIMEKNSDNLNILFLRVCTKLSMLSTNFWESSRILAHSQKELIFKHTHKKSYILKYAHKKSYINSQKIHNLAHS